MNSQQDLLALEAGHGEAWKNANSASKNANEACKKAKKASEGPEEGCKEAMERQDEACDKAVEMEVDKSGFGDGDDVSSEVSRAAGDQAFNLKSPVPIPVWTIYKFIFRIGYFRWDFPSIRLDRL